MRVIRRVNEDAPEAERAPPPRRRGVLFPVGVLPPEQKCAAEREEHDPGMADQKEEAAEQAGNEGMPSRSANRHQREQGEGRGRCEGHVSSKVECVFSCPTVEHDKKERKQPGCGSKQHTAK